MRLSRITCCTISALLGSGVAAQANEGLTENQPKSTDFDEQPDLNFSHPDEKYQVAAAVIPSQVSRIVPPETHFNSLEVVPPAAERQAMTEVAIAPTAERQIDQNNPITPESPEFISEFEWSAAPATDLNVAEIRESEARETSVVQAPQLLAVNESFTKTTDTQAAVSEELFLNHNQEFEQDSEIAALPEFVPVEGRAIAEPVPQISEVQSVEPQLFAANSFPVEATNQKEIIPGDLLLNHNQEFEYTSEVHVLAEPSPQVSEAVEVAVAPELLFAQNSSGIDCESCTPVEPLVLPEVNTGVSPALSINIPVGFGADQNTVFLSSTYQAVLRENDGYSTLHSGVGIGLGNASETVGFELSYSQDTDSTFGDGGFNAKLHKRFTPDFAGSLGWNGFLNTGRNDYEHSLYGSLTKVFRTRESLDDSFSRIAVTAGLGTNQFRSDAAVRAGNNDINAFGNITIRVAKPVSFITEWSGQDLGVGVSIAPFENFPLVITPAIRDIFDGDGSRFVLGVGLAQKF